MGGSVPALPGIKAEPELTQRFRREVADLLGRKSLSFPGAQPVSFARKHITALQTEDYYVCEKSDGIRCLLYLAAGEGGSEIHYLIDRKNEYYFQQGLHFPVPNDETLQLFHIDTIVDGELVNDRLPDGTYQLNYLVFDCLILDGNSLMQRTLDKRLAYFRDKVYNPYEDLYRRFPEEVAYLPFIVRFKRMEKCYAIEMMFRDILPNLPHGSDGLIFTARNRPYLFGTDEHIVKWKPESENSIDFQLNLDFPWRDPDSDEEAEGDTEPKPDWDAKPTAILSVKHGQEDHRPYANMYMTDDEWERLKGMGRPLQETIIECAQDDRGRWRFLRFRDDKNDANHIRTVESVMESIQDRVSRRDLAAAAKKMRDEWKKREQEQGSTTRVEGGEKSGHDEDQRRRLENERRRLAEDGLRKKRQQEDEYHRRQRPQQVSQKTDNDDDNGDDDDDEENNNDDVEEMERDNNRRRSLSSYGDGEAKGESRLGDDEEPTTTSGGGEKGMTKRDDEEEESDEDDEPEPIIAYHSSNQDKEVTLNHDHDSSNDGGGGGDDGPSPLKRKAEAEVEVGVTGNGSVDDDDDAISSFRIKRRAGRGDYRSFDGASSSPPSVASVSKAVVEEELSSDEDEPVKSHHHDGGSGNGSGGEDDDDDDEEVVENGNSQYTSSDTTSSA